MRYRLESHAVLILASAFSILTLSALAQPAAPAGSYRSTCTDAYLVDGTLVAVCQTADHQSRPTTLPNAASCTGDIANVNGKLQCVAQPAAHTTEFGEGYATFKSDCNGQDGARYLIIRMWGRADLAVKFVFDKRTPSKFQIFVPKGTTFAASCGGYPQNPSFRYISLD